MFLLTIYLSHSFQKTKMNISSANTSHNEFFTYQPVSSCIILPNSTIWWEQLACISSQNASLSCPSSVPALRYLSYSVWCSSSTSCSKHSSSLIQYQVGCQEGTVNQQDRRQQHWNHIHRWFANIISSQISFLKMIISTEAGSDRVTDRTKGQCCISPHW